MKEVKDRFSTNFEFLIFYWGEPSYNSLVIYLFTVVQFD